MATNNEQTVEQKLHNLIALQQTLSKIDNIRILRGELPLEVQDLEDDIEGKNTRLVNLEGENKKISQMLAFEKNKIAQAKDLIERYNEQLQSVKNNREYDNLTKEIEFQGLEIELSEKKIREFNNELSNRKNDITYIKEEIEGRSIDLVAKKEELNRIKSETKQEEEQLKEEALKLEENIEERLLKAFKRIREGARNGLAVVAIERDACGGCFNKIPAQKQLDIKLHKKIIVCEYCGRIMVDPDLCNQD